MIKGLKRFYKMYVKRDRWVVMACKWPYNHGYATYNPSKNMVLDSGLTKERAGEICRGLNSA